MSPKEGLTKEKLFVWYDIASAPTKQALLVTAGPDSYLICLVRMRMRTLVVNS